jgi:hypothetical protein
MADSEDASNIEKRDRTEGSEDKAEGECSFYEFC